MRFHGAFLASWALGLVGCSQLAAPVGSDSKAALVVSPRVETSGFRTQTLVSPYAQSDINHVVVRLFTYAGGIETPVVISGATASMDLPLASLSAPVIFANLHSQTVYRVRGYAYQTSGTSNMISSASSYVDITLTTDDRPTVGTLPVRLIDKDFAATSSVRISLSNPGSTHHVLAELFRVSGGSNLAISGATGSIPLANLPGTFMVGNLAANSTYQVIVSALTSSNSTLATQSVTFTVTNDTSVATQSLSINLAPT